MGNNLGVMTNNSAGVVDLLVGLLAVLGHNLLTLLNVSGVNLDVILSVTLLSLVLDRLLVALLVWLAEALQVVMRLAIASWGSQAQGRHGQNNGKSEHFGCRISSHLSPGVEAEAI